MLLSDRNRLCQLLAQFMETSLAIDQIEELVDLVEAALGNMNEKEIPSNEIGEQVMEHLRGLNEVAYVRFASVYRQFKDRSDFVRELEQLAN